MRARVYEMALIDNTRALGRQENDVCSPAKDVRLSTRLVAKAAATFGLPNLLHHAARATARSTTTDNHRQQQHHEHGVECVLWQSESCCSCTPLACLTGENNQDREALIPSPTTTTLYPNPTIQSECTSLDEKQLIQSDSKLISTYSASEIPSEEGSDGVTRTATNERGNLILRVCEEHDAEEDKERKDIMNDSLSEDVLLLDSNNASMENVLREKMNESTKEEDKINKSKEVQQILVPERGTHKRWVADYEKEWTFHPKLNHASLRILSQTGHSSVPVTHRLYEKRLVQSHSQHRLRDDFTFSPKLNAVSLRMAQERAERLPEVHARVSELAAQRLAEACANCTFHPNLSQKSLRIARRMDIDFLARQQQHLSRRQKKIEEARSSTLQQQRSYCKRSRPITLPTSSTPPHHTTVTTNKPSPHTHRHTSPKSSESQRARGRLLYRRSTQHPSSFSSTPYSSNPKTRKSSCKAPQQEVDTKRSLSTPSTARRRLSYTAPQPSSPTNGKQTTTDATGGKTATLPEEPWSQLSDTERVKRVKILGERAIKNKKVFVCRGGYNTIRTSLRRRGWVEKEYTAKESQSPYSTKIGANKKRREKSGASGRGRSRDQSHAPSDNIDDGSGRDEEGDGENGDMDEEEYSLLCRVIRSAEPNFVWTLRREDALYSNLLPSTPANHFAKASSFTTKVGLCTNLRSLVWCGETNSDLFFPRCYLLSSQEDKDLFIDDYYFTTALNMLKLVTDQYWGEYRSPNNTYSTPNQISRPPTNDSSRPPLEIDPPVERPVVPEEAVELAICACTSYISFREHEDIEDDGKCVQLKKTEWRSLVNYFYQLTLEKGRFDCSLQTVRRASAMLDKLEKYYLPQLHMDGARNIWIVKPGAMSRGRGIVCLERLEPILELVSSTVHKEGRWVVQKYIERPLLIHGTKFDIRQWFLITDWAPLTMWMYTDCYLRFATQKFTLDNMNESIHLCNNSIQKNYLNSDSRSELLPKENMWHNTTFKEYLESMDQGEQWDQVIYPGMKHALTCAMQVSQNLVERRKNSFELYGADFMVTDDFKPWLIEINCSPTMESSTSVTSQLCAEVMEDTIKVVVDRRENKECSTGKFELAYKQAKFDTPSYVGIQLCVEGVAIQQHRNHTHSHRTPSLPVAAFSYNN